MLREENWIARGSHCFLRRKKDLKWSEGGNPDAARGERGRCLGIEVLKVLWSQPDPWFSHERDESDLVE